MSSSPILGPSFGLWTPPEAGIHEQWGGVVPRLAQEGHKKAARRVEDLENG